MRIGVIGTGYVGLVHAAVMAEIGHEVLCADIDFDKINQLRKGECPIYEPGLHELLVAHTKNDRIFYTSDILQCAKYADIIFICVGTPPNKDGSPNLSFVQDVAQTIAKAIDKYKIIVNKSTVPVGTAKLVSNIIKQHQITPAPFDVVSNPEFLREGNAVKDAFNGDRIVIGSNSWKASDEMMQLYAQLNTRILITDTESAEMIKYAANAFLALKISFINSVADICEQTGANVEEVARGIGSDSRIGSQFLKAGLGYGGSCFGKDVDAFIHLADQYDIDFNILKATKLVNQNRTAKFIERIREQLSSLNDRNIAVLGLSFKPNTDDMRDAKSIPLIKQLIQEGAFVKAYDPVAIPQARKLIPNITYAKDAYDACETADAVIICTEWDEFKQLEWEYIANNMRDPIMFDGRNMFEKEEIEKLGWSYFSIGR